MDYENVNSQVLINFTGQIQIQTSEFYLIGGLIKKGRKGNSSRKLTGQ
jgi:hypothetical protein